MQQTGEARKARYRIGRVRARYGRGCAIPLVKREPLLTQEVSIEGLTGLFIDTGGRREYVSLGRLSVQRVKNGPCNGSIQCGAQHDLPPLQVVARGGTMCTVTTSTKGMEVLEEAEKLRPNATP